MEDFQDKVVVITGASSGIGERTAIDFARCGAKLALTGRNGDNLQRTVDQCVEAGQTAKNIFLLTGDLTVEDDVNRFIDGAIDKFGAINVLVSNAGQSTNGGLQSITVDDMDKAYNTNLRSVFMLVSRALPAIKKVKGNIVIVSSCAGTRPVEYLFAYSVVKAALNQFTMCLANELGPSGVRVNAVTPSVIKTNFFSRPGGLLESAPPEKLDGFYTAMGSAHPLQRVGEVEEISSAIRFLASEAASFTTGALFPLCGGRMNTMKGPPQPPTPPPPQTGQTKK